MKKSILRAVILALAIFSLFPLFVGCEKDEPIVPDPVGNPVITVTSSIIDNGDTKGITVQVQVSWIIENAIKATMGGKEIPLSGDTVISSNKGETKHLIFVAENLYGDKVQKDITISVPVLTPPTLSIVSTPDHLPIGGGQVHFTWITNAEYGVFYNGVSYFDGSTGITLNIPASGMDTLVFTAKGKGGETSVSVFVPVLQPTLTQLMYCNKKWQLVSHFETCPYMGIYHQEVTVSECILDNTFTLLYSDTAVYNNGSVLCPGDGIDLLYSHYSMTEDTLYYLGAPKHIEHSSTRDKLVVTFKDQYILSDTIVPYTIEQTFFIAVE